jgi:branched-chain amino acid transport system substrate-binding protein
MNILKRNRFALILVAFALLAAACGGDDDGGDTTTAAPEETTTTEAMEETTTTEAMEETTTTEAMEETTTTAAALPENADGELKIGYLLPQTGALSAIIDALVKPIEMGVAEMADAGFDVTLVPGDSGTDPAVASTSVDGLLNDGVDAIIGAAASGVSLSVIDKVTGSEVAMCSGSNTAASFTTYDDGGFYFRTAPSDVLQGPALADVMTDDGASSAAIVFRNDEYGAGFAEVLAEGLESNGVAVASEISYDPNATSFDAEAAELASAGVDAIAIIVFGEGAQLLQAMIEAGVGPADVQIYVADGFKDTVSAEDVDPANAAVLEGVRGTAPSAAPPNGEATFLDRLEAFAPGTPTIFSAHKHDCLVTFALASAVAGTDDVSVWVNEISGVTQGGTKCSTFAECYTLVQDGEDIDYDGASGPLEFTDVGEPATGVYDVYEYDAEGSAVTETQVEV